MIFFSLVCFINFFLHHVYDRPLVAEVAFDFIHQCQHFVRCYVITIQFSLYLNFIFLILFFLKISCAFSGKIHLNSLFVCSIQRHSRCLWPSQIRRLGLSRQKRAEWIGSRKCQSSGNGPTRLSSSLWAYMVRLRTQVAAVLCWWFMWWKSSKYDEIRKD